MLFRGVLAACLVAGGHRAKLPGLHTLISMRPSPRSNGVAESVGTPQTQAAKPTQKVFDDSRSTDGYAPEEDPLVPFSLSVGYSMACSGTSPRGSSPSLGTVSCDHESRRRFSHHACLVIATLAVRGQARRVTYDSRAKGMLLRETHLQ